MDCVRVKVIYNAPAFTSLTTLYTYDTLGNLVQVLDANGNVTTIAYDWLSRKTEMADPDMGHWSYLYDDNGNLVSQTDARGTVLTFNYDAMNRMADKKNGANTLASYSYDDTAAGNLGKGKRTGMTDAAGTASYTYDNRGRLTEEDRVIDSTHYITSYTYDGADNVVTITYPTGETVTQGYDEAERPSTLSGSTAGTLVSATLYNQLGSMSKIELGNGLRTVFQYHGIDAVQDGDPMNYYGKLYRIETFVAATPTTIRQDQRYWWDASGNLAVRTDAVAAETENFTYDFLDRLATADGPYSQTWEYDVLGNITDFDGTSYTYGTKPHAVTSVGAYTQSYDANGNMTGRANSTGTQTLTFDVENRLSQVEGTGGGYSGTATYVYDGDGNRIKKTEGGVTTLYVNRYYDVAIGSPDLETSHYYLGGTQVAIYRSDTGLEYIHQDSLNSSSLSTDDDGAQVSKTTFFPFGSARSSTGTLGTDQLYTGQRLDGTGLYFYNARYYDASIGRFISPDDIVTSLRSPQTLNRYSYVTNNPLRYTDPTGHAHTDGSADGGGFIDGDGSDGVEPGAGAPPIQNVLGTTLIAASLAIDSTIAGVPVGLVLGAIGAGVIILGNNPTLATDAAQAVSDAAQALWDSVFGSNNGLSKEQVRELEDLLGGGETGREALHDIKGGKNASKRELFREPNGDIVVKPKDGSGPGDPTNWRIKNGHVEPK